MHNLSKQKSPLAFLRKIPSGIGFVFKKIGQFIKNHKVWSVIIILAIIAGIAIPVTRNKKKDDTAQVSNEATVERRDIKSVITGSSTIEPNKEYSITSLVSGEITEAPFEEGDIVTKGQLMYKFDSSSMETSITSADIGIEKAEQSYQDTLDETKDAYIKSDISGTVNEILVKAGETVGAGTKIATVSDTSVLKAKVPFNAADASNIYTGNSATLTLVGTGSVLYGTVTHVGSASQALNGHMNVCYVTIEVRNPGAVNTGDSVTAMIGSIACNDVGKFEPTEERTITAKASGTLSALYISENDSVSKNATVGIIDMEYDSKLNSARLSVEDSKLSKEKLENQLKDYSITAPISGKVITKNLSAGDKYEMSNSSVKELALIYDMSSLCFTLNVDELDVKNINVGQAVTITADACEGTVYNGIVENVSISGTTSNGVTTYPVKVRINDFDDYLLPGMNIEAEITVSSAENVLTVPVNAVNRGDIVYVKGNKTDDKDNAPEGYHSVKVTTGISDDDYIEITDGLSEGDSIYILRQSSGDDFMMIMPGMGGGMGGPGGGMDGGMGGPPSGGGGGGMGGGMH